MVKTPKSVQSFLSRNLVTIVMVPVIIVSHLGWSALQKNRSLVKEHEEIDMPIVTFYKYCMRRLSGNNAPANVTAAKAENP